MKIFSDILTDCVSRCVKYVDLGQIRRYPKQWFRISEVCFYRSLSHKRSKMLIYLLSLLVFATSSVTRDPMDIDNRFLHRFKDILYNIT